MWFRYGEDMRATKPDDPRRARRYRLTRPNKQGYYALQSLVLIAHQHVFSTPDHRVCKYERYWLRPMLWTGYLPKLSVAHFFEELDGALQL